MARFLIASWDGGGNTPPAYHLGARLRRRGHQVGMTGWPSMAGRAGAAGLEFLTWPQLPAWPCSVAFEDDWDRLERYLFGAACRADIVAAAKRSGPGRLIIDCMLRAGFDAVRDVRLPAAGLVHVSYQGFVHEWDHQAMSTAVAAMLEPCTAVIAAHPARLDSPCPMPPGHAYVGPIADPAPGTLDPQLASTLATPGDPWLLVSLSTTTQCGQRAALARILGAVARLPVRALVTLGGAVTASDLDLPPNAVATRYIPHELALPHMSAVVSHAGMSTISTALAAGVPLICVPLGRDSQATRAASPQREPASPSARPQASASSPTPSPRSSAIPPMPARHEPSQPNSGPSAAASTPPASSRPSRHSKSQDHPVPPMGPAIGLACGCGATALLSLVPGTWKPNIPASAATAKDQDLHDHHAGAGPTPGSRAQRRRSARHRDSRP